MKSKHIGYLLFGLIITIGLWISFQAGGPDEISSADLKTQPHVDTESSPPMELARGSEKPKVALDLPTNTSIGPDSSSETILSVIEDASISYSASELPKIQPYLLHPDPAIRAAALQGMLVLGDAAASPMLRAAAKETTNPREAVALMDAADYLELPSAPIKLKRKSGTPQSPKQPASPAQP